MMKMKSIINQNKSNETKNNNNNYEDANRTR